MNSGEIVGYVIVDVYIHGNERTRGDLTPVMKHFKTKYYRVLVECLRELSLMEADGCKEL
jgi:hypothetical protein